MKHSKIIGIIYARMDSTRLPGKAFMEAAGKPMLQHVIDRAKRIEGLSEIVLATSDRKLDDPLANLAIGKGLSVYRGAWQNLASRTLGCAENFPAEYFVRINGDSPWLDYSLIAEGISLCRKTGCDFLTNLKPRTYPSGIAVEIVKFKTFQSAYVKMKVPYETENITSFFYSNSDFCSIEYFPLNGTNLSEIHLTVDTRDDFDKFSQVMNHFGPLAPMKNFRQVANFYQQEFGT